MIIMKFFNNFYYLEFYNECDSSMNESGMIQRNFFKTVIIVYHQFHGF